MSFSISDMHFLPSWKLILITFKLFLRHRLLQVEMKIFYTGRKSKS